MSPDVPELLPVWMQTEIGYVLWWLANPERGPNTGPDIIQRLLARGNVRNADEARQILRRAQENVAATARVRAAERGGTLMAACGYRCSPDQPIALRIRFDVLGPHNQLIQSRSIVINAFARDNLQHVLDRARDTFNSRHGLGALSDSPTMHLERRLDVADIDQVLIGYTEGSVWA